MSKDWQVWLNINVDVHSNFLLNSRNKCIGKNIVFNGNPEILFISDNISIIGYGKIYNEPELWKILNIPHYINIENKNNHSLRIIVELYKKYGFEDMLELIEGDYSFLLLDYNIHGDESWLYVVKDPFGIYPLYYYENLNNHPKKVQFEIEMKYYCFSSSEYSDNYEYKPFLSGHYQKFSHSHKVSAIWKRNHRPSLFYKLPFCSIYNDSDHYNTIEYQHKQIQMAIEKRLRWISYKNEKTSLDKKIKIGVLCLIPEIDNINITNIFTYLEKKDDVEVVSITPLSIQNKDNSFVFEWTKFIPLENRNDLGSSILQIEYMEKEYPTIITRLKTLLNSNDPYVIRSHFIPMIIAKYLTENMPDIKHVFLGEKFTFDWIEKKYLERRKWIMQIYLDDMMKGWTQIFLSYGIELYMPFLDRILMQNIKPISIL